MAWEVDVQSPRVADSDLSLYKFYRDGALAGTVAVGALNPIPFTYQIADDGLYQLTVSSVDQVGNESAQSAQAPVTLDSVAPSVPQTPFVVAIRFV